MTKLQKGDIIQIQKFKVTSMNAEPKEYLETYIVGKVWSNIGYFPAISADTGEIIVLREEVCKFVIKGGDFLIDKLFN